MKDKIYKDISDFLRWGDFDDALAVLKQNPDLDTTHNNGEFILRAIESKNIPLIKYLIENYRGLKTEDVLEYQKALYKMQTIIKEAVDTCDIPKDVAEIISSYDRSHSDAEDTQSLLGSVEECGDTLQ